MESYTHTKTPNEQSKPKSRTSYPLARKYAAIRFLDSNPHTPKTTVAKLFGVPRSALYLDEKQRSDYEKYRDTQIEGNPALIQERSRLEQQTSLLRRVLVIYDSYLVQDDTKNKSIEEAGPLIQDVMKNSMIVPQKMIKFSRDYLLRHLEFVTQYESTPCIHEHQLYRGSMTEWVVGATIGLYKPCDIYFCDTVEEYLIHDDQSMYYAAQLLCCNSDASIRESSCIEIPTLSTYQPTELKAHSGASRHPNFYNWIVNLNSNLSRDIVLFIRRETWGQLAFESFQQLKHVTIIFDGWNSSFAPIRKDRVMIELRNKSQDLCEKFHYNEYHTKIPETRENLYSESWLQVPSSIIQEQSALFLAGVGWSPCLQEGSCFCFGKRR